MKEKIDKIFLIVLCCVIIISSIFVGSPLEKNYLILSVIINVVAFIYLCIKSIIGPKRNWIDNLLCIAVFMLIVSSCIPIIFRKCVSLSDSIQSVLVYMSLFSVFIMLKEIQVKNKKKYITYSIIISACISCIIGFDNLTFKSFEGVLKKFGNANFVNPDHRMFANFGYANAFALYIAVALFLTLNEYKKAEKMWEKLIDTALLNFFMICVLLSYSRGTWICLTICIILNIIFDKDKKTKFRQIGILALTEVMSLLFAKIYSKLYSTSQYLVIYFLLIMTLLMSSFIQLAIKFIKNKIKIKKKINIKIKYIIITVIAVSVLIIITFILLLKYTKPLVLFNTFNGENEYTQNINYVPDEDGNYEIKIDLEAQSSLKDKSAYEIVIKERNKYDDIVSSHSIPVNNEKETKTIKFEKQQDTKHLTITYKSLYKSERRGLTINALTINGKNIVVEYKYLPTKIIEKIKNTNGNNSSTWERFVFIRDGIKIIAKDGIIGLGGNAWEYMQYKVQEYKYGSKEVHSYPIEIWMEFGIIGFIALIMIAAYIIKSIKNSEHQVFSIALLLILFHSCFDFGMSFYIIQLTFFILLACINESKEKKFINLSNYIILIIIFIGLIGNSLYFISDVIYQKKIYRKEDKEEEAKICIAIYPFNVDARQYLIAHTKGENQRENILWWVKYESYRKNNWILSVLSSNIGNKEELIESTDYLQKGIEQLTSEIQEEYIEMIYKIVTSDKVEMPFNVNNEMERYLILQSLTERLDVEKKEQFKEILENERNKLYEKIQNKNSRIKKEYQEEYLERLSEK